MKIFISYVSAGSGHKRIAESIAAYFKINCPAYEIRTMDALDYANPVLRDIYSKVYDFLVRFAKWLWKISFWFTDVKCFYFLSRPLMFISHRLTTSGFAKLLIKEQPDIIISTHFLSSEIAAHLKKTGKIKALLTTVITDYGVHSYWIHKNTDIYAVASLATKQILVSKGASQDCVHVTGLPVDDKFLARPNRELICGRLGLQKDKFTCLIMTGSFGIGPIEHIAEALHSNIQLLIVCARNNALYERLRKRNLDNVKIFGFVDFVYDLMAASDIIITKPGGSSISEILAMRLVPVFISAIPGQEYENARILNEYGIGISPRSTEELKLIVLDYKSHPEKISAVKADIKNIFIPHANSELCNVVCKSCVRTLN